MELFLSGFTQMLDPIIIILIFIGVFAGIIFGASPGLTAAMGMSFALPLTYVMPPLQAIALILGLYIGGASGGLITAILINIPGTPACIATTFDGHPMAAKGKPAKALGYGIISSFFGGIISLIVLTFASPFLAKIALEFGPTEYFSVSLFALALIAGLAGKSMLKGLTSGVIGLMLATVGQAPLDASRRFTMGIRGFNNGFQLLCALIGVYAISEILKYAENGDDGTDKGLKNVKISGLGVKLKDFAGQWVNVIRSSLVGVGIGILPGIGGATSNLIAYSITKKTSKYPEKFGTGIKDGIIASETANNAVSGGALIPLLTLGIPGDAGTAILLAAMTLHGVTPGPLLFETNGNLIYSIFTVLFIANIAMMILEYFGMKIFVKMVQIPKCYLLSTIFILSTIGAMAQNNRIFDIWAVLIFGFIAYILYQFDVPPAPLIMGFILGPIVEINLLRGLMLTEGNFLRFFDRPIPLIAILITIFYLGYTFYHSIMAILPKTEVAEVH